MSLHHHDTGHDIVIDIDNASFLAPALSCGVKNDIGYLYIHPYGRYMVLVPNNPFIIEYFLQGGSDGRGQPTASPMLTAIMSGGVEISGRELYKYR